MTNLSLEINDNNINAVCLKILTELRKRITSLDTFWSFLFYDREDRASFSYIISQTDGIQCSNDLIAPFSHCMIVLAALCKRCKDKGNVKAFDKKYPNIYVHLQEMCLLYFLSKKIYKSVSKITCIQLPFGKFNPISIALQSPLNQASNMHINHRRAIAFHFLAHWAAQFRKKEKADSDIFEQAYVKQHPVLFMYDMLMSEAIINTQLYHVILASNKKVNMDFFLETMTLSCRYHEPNSKLETLLYQYFDKTSDAINQNFKSYLRDNKTKTLLANFLERLIKWRQDNHVAMIARLLHLWLGEGIDRQLTCVLNGLLLSDAFLIQVTFWQHPDTRNTLFHSILLQKESDLHDAFYWKIRNIGCVSVDKLILWRENAANQTPKKLLDGLYYDTLKPLKLEAPFNHSRVIFKNRRVKISLGKYADQNIIEKRPSRDDFHSHALEIFVYQTCQHENIATLLAYTIDPMRLYLPYEPQGNLSDYMQAHQNNAKTLDNKTIRSLMLDIILGLKCLHQNYIVHGDLALANILVSKQGRAKIIDFDHAHVFSATQQNRIERISSLFARAEYTAPEVLRIEAQQKQMLVFLQFAQFKKVDCYALGVMLYCLVAGHNGWRNAIYCAITHKEYRDSIYQKIKQNVQFWADIPESSPWRNAVMHASDYSPDTRSTLDAIETEIARMSV